MASCVLYTVSVVSGLHADGYDVSCCACLHVQVREGKERELVWSYEHYWYMMPLLPALDERHRNCSDESCKM